MSNDMCCSQHANEMDKRLSRIEDDIKETKEVFLKIWAFIESMKDNPMLAAMTGGLGKK